jgi:hypothetical protein
MRYMTLVKTTENSGPPPKALMDAIARLGEEGMKAGVMVETGGLLPTATATRIRLAGGKLTVTDGPFTETKEVIGGYAVFDVKSKEEMLQWATRFMQLHKEHWKGWEGETEIRQMWDAPAFAHEAAHR